MLRDGLTGGVGPQRRMLFKRLAQGTVLVGRKLLACLLIKGRTVSASACGNNLRQKTVMNTGNKIPVNILFRDM